MKIRYIVAPVYDWTAERTAEAPGYYKSLMAAKLAKERIPAHIKMFYRVYRLRITPPKA